MVSPVPVGTAVIHSNSCHCSLSKVSLREAVTLTGKEKQSAPGLGVFGHLFSGSDCILHHGIGGQEAAGFWPLKLSPVSLDSGDFQVCLPEVMYDNGLGKWALILGA